MRALTPRERRTARLGAGVLIVYLAGFWGLRAWRHLEARRSEYEDLALEAQSLRAQVDLEDARRQRLERLKSSTRIDVARLDSKTLVSEAVAALGKAAQSCGLTVSTLKETPGRTSERELAVIQIEAVSTLNGALQFLHGLRSLGYPLVADKLQLKTPGMQPGQVKLSLGVAVVGPTAQKTGGRGA
jgi:hypothetical protein